jgi:hypothetical protein
MKAGVMTKSTLKALWLGGGGLLATWLAVTPTDTAPGKSRVAVAERPVVIHESTADNLVAQVARLRDQAGNVQLASSTRNPFRFGSSKPAGTMPQPGSAAPVVSAAPPAPAQPSLSLSGIAERKTPQGNERTAIISGAGQLYLVKEGEMVAGRYRVVSVDSDAVTLRDDNGTEIRLSYTSLK